MAITKVGVTQGFNRVELQGLSTDTKPTTYGDGSTFLELDTGKFWVYDKGNPGTNNGWWNVCVLKLA